MGLIFKIAWRNIFRHKGKSLVIGAILFVGALLMTVGNGVTTGMNKGLQQHIVDDFSGDIVIASDKLEGDNVFLDAMGKSIEPITNFKAIDSVLKTQPYLEKYLPMGKNMVMVLNDQEGSPDGGYVLGVDWKRYRDMFPENLRIIQGTVPDSGSGLLMPTGGRKTFFMSMGMWFTCKDCPLDTVDMPDEGKRNISNITPATSAVFMGMGGENTTTDVRVDIKAIVKYRALNHIWGSFLIMDIESYRQSMGYFTAAESKAEIPADRKELLSLGSGDLDALFSDASLMTTNSAAPAAAAPAIRTAPVVHEAVDQDDGAYNIVLVRLKDGENLKARTAGLTKLLKDAGTGVRAIEWNKAIGPVGSMAVLIKAALFVFVMFLFFVAVIIIVNTLSMAALERVSEIGMMRAVGARKGFISAMFFAETALLSFFFGGVGIAGGALIIKVVSLLRLTTNNDMIQLLYGGDRFNPFLTPTDLVLCLIQLILVTLVAVVYPLTIARKITPLDAISRE